MAIENKCWMNGEIQKRKINRNPDGRIKSIDLAVLVVRRPEIVAGNKSGFMKYDIVLAHMKDEKWIEYIIQNDIAEGDMIEIYGVIKTKRDEKEFTCPICGHKNVYEGVYTYVIPRYIRAFEIKPKQIEVVWLTDLECKGTKEELQRILMQRKVSPGDIVRIKDLGMDIDGFHKIQLVVKEKTESEEVLKYLDDISEISNHVFVMGNLCADPIYVPPQKKGRICSYQIGISRSFDMLENLENKKEEADYPWIRSLGRQAEKDSIALSKSSAVYVEGSLQAREDFDIHKVCENCNTTVKTKSSAMEILTYYIGYLKDCNLPPKDADKEDPKWQAFFKKD